MRPADKFSFAPGRGYTPPDAPVEAYIELLDHLGFARGLLVQGNAHGYDNRVLLDALTRFPRRLRGVAITDTRIAPATLHDWHRLGMRGLRFHLFSEAWRIAVDDLPNAQVIPPADFTGSMTIMAELRTGNNEVLVRTPLQLVWRPTALKSSEPPSSAKESKAVELTPTAPPEFYEEKMVKEPLGQTLAWQKDSAVNQTSPRIKTRKHVLRTAKERTLARKRQHPSSALVMETDTVSRWRVVPSSNYPTSAYSDARAERKPPWSDVHALIDRSWERCKDGCWQRR